MFQTLKPQRANAGGVKYLVAKPDSFNGTALRKPRRRPRCNVCKLDKLQRHEDDSKGCSKCQKQKVVYSPKQKTARNSPPSGQKQHSQDDCARDKRDQHDRWKQIRESASTPQPTKQQQRSRTSDLLEAGEEGTGGNMIRPIHDSAESILPNSFDLAVDVDLMKDVQMHQSAVEDFGTSDIDIGSQNTYESGNDSKSLDTSSYSPISFESVFFLGDLQTTDTDLSVTDDLMTIDATLSSESCAGVGRQPNPGYNSTSTTIQPHEITVTSPAFTNSPPSAEQLLPQPLQQQVDKDGNASCECMDLLLSAHEQLQLQSAWPSGNSPDDGSGDKPVDKNFNSNDHVNISNGFSAINVDGMLECQRWSLISIAAVLGCAECSSRSDLAILSLLMCEDMLRSITSFRDSSPIPITAIPNAEGSKLPSNHSARSHKGSRSMQHRRRSNGVDRMSSETTQTKALLSVTWLLDDHVETQLARSLVDLRAKRVEKLIEQITEVAVRNHFACLPLAQAISRQFRTC